MSDKRNYRVWCLSWDQDESDGVDILPHTFEYDDKLRWGILDGESVRTAERAAEVAADWYHSRRDAWESSWPLEFRVRLPDLTTEDYTVDRETVPEFSASRIRGRPSIPPPEDEDAA